MKNEIVGFVVLVLGGAVLGFVAGHIIWFIYGQIQLYLHIDFPYAALMGPPNIYQIGWTILGIIAVILSMGPRTRAPEEKFAVTSELSKIEEMNAPLIRLLEREIPEEYEAVKRRISSSPSHETRRLPTELKNGRYVVKCTDLDITEFPSLWVPKEIYELYDIWRSRQSEEFHQPTEPEASVKPRAREKIFVTFDKMRIPVLKEDGKYRVEGFPFYEDDPEVAALHYVNRIKGFNINIEEARRKARSKTKAT